MHFLEITGAEHKTVKRLAGLKEKKYRERYGEFLVEGENSVLWALDSPYTVNTVVKSNDYTVPQSFIPFLEGKQLYSVPPHIFAKIADTKTPQGILCSCALPQAPPLPKSGLFLYCDRVRDPGNVGSMIRSADAMGLDGVMLSPESVDPYNPKLVRSTMGSLFHLRLYTSVSADMLDSLKQNGFSLAVSALSNQSITPDAWQVAPNTILAVGNEAHGVSDRVCAMADVTVKIPMHGSAESLNVAAAAAILLYEAAKRGGRI